MIALIPARAGSKRVPGKNTRVLAGHPLIAYTITAAQQSGVFDEGIAVASDDRAVLQLGLDMMVGAYERTTVDDAQPDVAWIREVFAAMLHAWRRSQTGLPRSFAILRPTSPFRTAATIRRAFREFSAMADCGDSIRAVERCPVNVYKCWTWAGAGMPIRPLLEGTTPEGVPLHSAPSQLAPSAWIQNSSLEMAYTANVEIHGSIAGKKIGPFFTRGVEGLSIDTEDDWAKAVDIAARWPQWLPQIGVHA